jgi:hypothetical protein
VSDKQTDHQKSTFTKSLLLLAIVHDMKKNIGFWLLPLLLFTQAVFSQTITITSPNGGEKIAAGTTTNINWTFADGGAGFNTFSIVLLIGDQQYRTIATNVASTQIPFAWSVPADLPARADYRIRISRSLSPGSTDVSDAAFEVTGGQRITVTSPNGGEAFERGKPMTITWTNNFDSPVTIQLLRNGITSQTLVSETPDTGTFTWSVPSDLTEANTYRIRIFRSSDLNVIDDSDANFLIGRFIRVTAPATGQVVSRGADFNITWADNISENVKIELFQGSTSVAVLSPEPAGAPSNGSFTWAVNSMLPNGNNYKIRVTSVADNTITAESGNFTIGEFIRVTYPNGGEILSRGSRYTITWEDNVAANVKIELFKGGSTTPVVISADTPSSGSFNWTVPNALTEGTDYKIKITSLIDGVVTDESNANFTIQSSSIAVTAPAGGERWQRRKAYVITWTDNFPENVKIDLLKNGALSQVLAASETSDGAFSWEVPAGITIANDYRVRISSVSRPDLTATSAADFAITSADTIVVAAPNGGETLVKGSNTNITWTSNLTGGNVAIELLINDVLVGAIAASAPNNGTYSWTVPFNLGSSVLAPSNLYKVRVRSIESPQATDVSNNNFSIVNPAFRLTYPNVVDNLPRRLPIRIEWTSGLRIDSMRIELMRSGAVERVIAAKYITQGNAFFDWTIPADIPVAGGYRIRITNLASTDMTDDSDGTFAIFDPTIQVLTPNGGENWFSSGFRYAITWQTNLTTPLRIELLRNNVLVQNITDNAVNGRFDWTLPNNLAAATNYRIRISAPTATSVNDESNANFTITTPFINVTAPVTGEVWLKSLTYDIRWSTNIPQDQLLRIDLLANNALVRNIATTTENDGLFRFSPADFLANGTNYRIKVTLADNENVSSLNPGDFTIKADDVRPVITNTDMPSLLEVNGFLQEVKSIAPKIVASDNVGITRVQCFFKEITKSSWLSRDATFANNSYGVFISSTEFGEIGIEYYFEVSDRVGNIARTNNVFAYLRYPNKEGLAIPSVVYGFNQEDYQIVSVPLILDNKSPLSVLEDNLGPYNKGVWRMLHFDGTEKLEATEKLSEIEIGKGYWLIATAKVTDPDTGPGRVPNVTPAAPFEINLRAGWNQIGNPYNFNISWADVKLANPGVSGVGNLKVFNKSFQSSDELRRFRGAFVFADVPAKLKIPTLKNRVLNPGRTEGNELRNPIDAADWEVRLEAVSSSGLALQEAGVGMRSTADPSKDEFDEMTLPRLFKYLEINFEHPEYFYPKFAKDVVPSAEKHTWEFSVESNTGDDEITLRWDNSYFGQNKKLFLLDLQTQRSVDMSKTDSYTFAKRAAKSRFRVLYGTEAEVNAGALEALKTPSLSVFPNPINAQSRISYALPADFHGAQVSLEIYDATGRQVSRLLQSDNTPSGFYEVDFADITLSKGLYLCRLTVNMPQTGQSRQIVQKVVVE